MCLLQHNHNDDTNNFKSKTIPAVPLQSLPQLYDTCLPIAGININSSQDSYDCNDACDLNIESLIMHEDDSGKNREINLVQYPIEKDAMSAAYTSDCGEVHIRREDEKQMQSTFILSINDADSFQEKRILRVEESSSGYIVADFCGVNGYEQILFLPPWIVKEDSSTMCSSITEQKTMLERYLMQCVLADGKSIMYHSESKIDISYSEPIPSIRLAPMNAAMSDTEESERKKKKRKVMGNCNGANEQSSSNITTHSQNNASHNRGEETEWQKKLRIGIQRRLDQELALQKKHYAITKIKEKLIVQSRRVLKDLSLARKGDHSSLEMVRMHYSLYPVNDLSNSLSVQLHLEVDLVLNADKYGFKGTNLSESCLYDVQLSCSPQSRRDEMSVRTQSAIVPTFGKGDCFTILAVSGIKFSSSALAGGNADVQLTLNAFFRNVPTILDDSRDTKMKGLILGSISIPRENLILCKTSPSNVIEFSDRTKRDYPTHDMKSLGLVPTAIFDYRVPRILIIDISNSASNDIKADWQKIVEPINSACTPGNRIDFHYEEGRMSIELIVFAPSPEQRLGLLQSLLRFIPRIVGTQQCVVNDDYMAESFAAAMKKELQIIEHHAASSKPLSRGGFNDIIRAQCISDEIAVRMMENRDSE